MLKKGESEMDKEKRLDGWDVFADVLSANTWGKLGLVFIRLRTLRKSKHILFTGGERVCILVAMTLFIVEFGHL